MKVLLISESPLEKRDSNYFAQDSWIKFPINLANHFEAMTMWSPIIYLKSDKEASLGSWPVKMGALNIEAHDNYNSFLSYYKLWPFRIFAWRKKAKNLIANHDVILLRLPSPSLGLISGICQKLKKPFVPLIAGDMSTQSDKILGSTGFKKIFYNIITNYLARQEIKHCQKASAIYTWSQELSDRHFAMKSIVKQIRTPHLSESDFSYREDTCLDKPIKLLRVAWLLPSKGFESIFEAMSLLLKKGYDVVLEIVGKERSAGYQEYLTNYLTKIGLKDRVTFSGWIPFDKIGSVYTNNDIQIISSLAEGTPRCIIEGFARGIPLVCTAVGGCIDVLTHRQNALLIPPNSPEDMAIQIEAIITDKQLRQNLIKNGYESAKSVSFESVGYSFVSDLKALIRGLK